MNDKAKWYTTAKVINYYKSHGIIRIPWPIQSPDLNPIKNTWRLMKLRILKRRHRIRSVKEMERVLLEEWDRITPEDYRRCISSMPKRIDLIYKNKGSSIKY
jgi:transposase